MSKHQDYSVEFKPDWTKYPKLASIFEHRPSKNVYWEELRELLVEARADAVRFVHDARVEELAAARANERKRSRSVSFDTVHKVYVAIHACEREDADPHNDFGDVGDTLEKCKEALRAVVQEVGG